MEENDLKVAPVNAERISDRLRLCWGHLDNWRNLDIVGRCKKWLEETDAIFTPTTFVAYQDGKPVGMIEFVPHRLLKEVKLCPCRVDEESGEVEERYAMEEQFEDYLFISCLLVRKDSRSQGVGGTLLNHLLHSKVIEDFDGTLVYVTERDESWDSHIHWPTGPKEFYLKHRFTVLKTMQNPTEYILIYRKRMDRTSSYPTG